MDRVRTARALLRVAMALLCKARHRHGKGSWGNALRRHSAALIATQGTAEDEHCVARLGQGIETHGSASAEHRIALHYTARAKFSEASQRLSTTAHGNGNEQLRPAPRRHGIEPRRQSMDTQSGGRAVNLCARDWQGKSGNRYGIARPRTATAMHGRAAALQGHDMLCDCSVKQCGAWHGEEMPLRRQGAADIGAQTQRTTNYPFSRGAGLKSAPRCAMRERMDEWASRTS